MYEYDSTLEFDTIRDTILSDVAVRVKGSAG